MTKVAGSNGKSRYAILEEHTPDVLSDKYSRVLKDAVIAMNIGQNIVVVKQFREWPWRQQQLLMP